jgi:hypothetical protein
VAGRKKRKPAKQLIEKRQSGRPRLCRLDWKRTDQRSLSRLVMNPTRGSAQPASAFFSSSAGENMPGETIAGRISLSCWPSSASLASLSSGPYAANVYHFTGQSMETL